MKLKDRDIPQLGSIEVRRSLLSRAGIVLQIGNRPHSRGHYEYADVELSMKDARRLAKEIVRLADLIEPEEAE